MANYSVSYGGIANMESRIHQLAMKVDGISNDLYTAANKVGNAKSLENKGYATMVRKQCELTSRDADALARQGAQLTAIGETYEQTERRLLEALDTLVSQKGFSGTSAQVVQHALKTHRAYQRNEDAHRKVDDVLGGASRKVKDAVEAFRYWRSTTGSKWVKKGSEFFLGEGALGDPVVSEAIKDVNKDIEKYEDIINGVLNFNNPDARARGAKALARTKLMKALNIGSLSGFIDMVPRYADMTDAVSNRGAEMWARGDKGKAICYALSATTLMSVQFAGDAVYNSGKYLVGVVTKDFFSDKIDAEKKAKAGKKILRSWNVVKEGADKGISMGEGGLEGVFTTFGDWCWSRLDDAYGA